MGIGAFFRSVAGLCCVTIVSQFLQSESVFGSDVTKLSGKKTLHSREFRQPNSSLAAASSGKQGVASSPKESKKAHASKQLSFVPFEPNSKKRKASSVEKKKRKPIASSPAKKPRKSRNSKEKDILILKELSTRSVLFISDLISLAHRANRGNEKAQFKLVEYAQRFRVMPAVSEQITLHTWADDLEEWVLEDLDRGDLVMQLDVDYFVNSARLRGALVRQMAADDPQAYWLFAKLSLRRPWGAEGARALSASYKEHLSAAADKGHLHAKYTLARAYHRHQICSSRYRSCRKAHARSCKERILLGAL